MIARLLVILSLMLLVAAPAPELAGAALAVQLELADEPVPLADDEVAAPPASAPAAPPARVARPGTCQDGPPPARAHTQIFRPPRPSLA